MPQAPVCCHQDHKSFFKSKLFLVSIITLVLVFLSYSFVPLETFRKVLFSYFKSIWWAVALGLFLGGMIDYYIRKKFDNCDSCFLKYCVEITHSQRLELTLRYKISVNIWRSGIRTRKNKYYFFI